MLVLLSFGRLCQPCAAVSAALIDDAGTCTAESNAVFRSCSVLSLKVTCCCVTGSKAERSGPVCESEVLAECCICSLRSSLFDRSTRGTLLSPAQMDCQLRQAEGRSILACIIVGMMMLQLLHSFQGSLRDIRAAGDFVRYSEMGVVDARRNANAIGV